MDLGQAGVIDAAPQRLVDGKWKRAPNARAATRWRARCYVRDQTGIRREVTRFNKTKRQAEEDCQKAVDYIARAGDGTMVPNMPLLKAGELWFEHVQRKDSGLSARTLTDYRYAWDRYVAADGSSLRGLTLEEANSPQRLRGFLRLVADRYGSASAKMTRSALNGVLNLAVGNGVLTTNAMLQVGLVKSSESRPVTVDTSRAFTIAERDSILEYAYGLVVEAEANRANPRALRKLRATADLACLMAGIGVRIDEARTMRWEDINLTTGAIVVRGTKTEGSLRRVDAPAWLLGRLVSRSEEVGHTGLVIPSPTFVNQPEKPWEQSNSSKALRKLLTDAGFPWAVPHSFRRTVASILHDQGVPVARIADWLGHSNPNTTITHYLGRNLDGSKKDLADLL